MVHQAVPDTPKHCLSKSTHEMLAHEPQGQAQDAISSFLAACCPNTSSRLAHPAECVTTAAKHWLLQGIMA